MNKQQFIPVANHFFGDEKLTPNELYIYSYLYSGRTYFYDTTKTNLALIETEVRIVKKDQDNRKYLLEAMQSLRDKGVIEFESEDIKKDKCLDISFVNIEKGYEKIPLLYFEMTSDPEEYMILCYVKKIKRGIAAVEFADILGRSVSHVKSQISTMEQKGLLNVIHGKYYVNEEGQTRKEKNAYSVNQQYAPTVDKDEQDDSTVEGEEGKETREHNWYDSNSLINVDDCIVFLTTHEEGLKQFAQKRIDRILKSTGKKVFEKIIWEAENRVAEMEYAKKKNEEEEQFLEMHGTPIRLKIGAIVEATADNINEFDFLREVERVFYVEHSGVKSFLIHQDLFADDRRYSVHTLESVIEILKKQIEMGKLDRQGYNTVSHSMRSIIGEMNQGRQYDEDWEGDRWIISPLGEGAYEEENLSKQERIRQNKQRAQIEKKRQEREERKNDILSIFYDRIE